MFISKGLFWKLLEQSCLWNFLNVAFAVWKTKVCLSNWFHFDKNKANLRCYNNRIILLQNINPVGVSLQQCSFKCCADTISTFRFQKHSHPPSQINRSCLLLVLSFTAMQKNTDLFNHSFFCPVVSTSLFFSPLNLFCLFCSFQFISFSQFLHCLLRHDRGGFFYFRRCTTKQIHNEP